MIDNIAQIFEKIKELENSKDNKFDKDHYDSIATVDCAWVSYEETRKLHDHFLLFLFLYVYCFLMQSALEILLILMIVIVGVMTIWECCIIVFESYL